MSRAVAARPDTSDSTMLAGVTQVFRRLPLAGLESMARMNRSAICTAGDPQVGGEGGAPLGTRVSRLGTPAV